MSEQELKIGWLVLCNRCLEHTNQKRRYGRFSPRVQRPKKGYGYKDNNLARVFEDKHEQIPVHKLIIGHSAPATFTFKPHTAHHIYP